MPNVIKYNTSTESLSLRKGNFYLGVGDVGKGPTSSTGFYNGINPPSGGYTVYLNKESGGPSIYTTTGDTALINLTNGIANTSYTGVQQCFVYFAGQSDKMVVNENYPSIVTSGLVLNVDASFLPSYPKSGTTWYDNSVSPTNGVLYNGPTFDNTSNSLSFDGSDDHVVVGKAYNFGSSGFSIFVVAKPLEVSNAHSLVFQGFYADSGWFINTYNSAVRFFTNQGGAVQTSSTGSVLQSNKWLHVGIVRNGSSVKIYINGVDSTTYPATHQNPANSGYSLQIAKYGTTGYQEFWNGNISLVQIYDTNFSESQVLQNYYQGPITTGNVELYLDAGNLVSYQSGNTTTYSLTGSLGGTLVNGTGFDTKNGGSYVFDGTDDGINSTANLPTMNTFTVEYFIKLENQPNYTSHQILYTYADNVGIEFEVSSRQMWIWNGSVNRTSTSFNLDTWYHVTWTSQSGDTKVYVNGVLNNSFGSFRAISGGFWNIGSFGSGRRMKGNLGLMRIYSKVLTASEVSQNFNAQRDRFGI